jgi:ATP-binding cassette subfamily B protein
MEKGKIIETGNHDMLLAASGHYATLYNMYFRHQSLEYKPEGLEEYLEYKTRLDFQAD